MLDGTAPAVGQAVFPGLDQLQARVENWDIAMRTLELTATAIAESMGVVALHGSGAAPASFDQSDAHGSLKPSSAAVRTTTVYRSQMTVSATGLLAPPPATMSPRPSPSLPPALFLSASQLKPGRLIVVANLQGAYHTLVELLSRLKFDFRQDNLMHLGNLVAPPALPATTTGGAATCGAAGAGVERRRCRHSTPLLKLIRRHCAAVGGGAGGPMGANECLALLAAARENRQRALQQQQQEEEQARQLWEWPHGQRESGCAGGSLGGAGAARAALLASRRSALSLQIAATAMADRAGSRPGGVATATHPSVAARWGGDSDSDSSVDEDDSSDSDGEEGGSGLRGGKEELVPAPVTPCREEASPSPLPRRGHARPTPMPGQAAASPRLRTAAPGKNVGLACGGGARGGAPSGQLDDTDLAQMLSMPTCVVLQPYGIMLQHTGPSPSPVDAATSPLYHTLYSHRRGGSGGPSASTSSTATGLASCRDVVRCAVIPPLRTLQRRSPGFVSCLAAGRAPYAEDLFLEVVEEPLSDLDLGSPQHREGVRAGDQRDIGVSAPTPMSSA